MCIQIVTRRFKVFYIKSKTVIYCENGRKCIFFGLNSRQPISRNSDDNLTTL